MPDRDLQEVRLQLSLLVRMLPTRLLLGKNLADEQMRTRTAAFGDVGSG